MITCSPFGGICNRLKCLISTLAFTNNIYLDWTPTITEGGVKTSFDTCFTNKYNPTRKDYIIIKSCQFIDEKMNQESGIHELNEDKKEKYIQVINSLEPIIYIKEKIIEFKKMFDDNTISVSVRTFTSFNKEYIKLGIKFNIELLFNEMDKYPTSKFFITCDSEMVFYRILERYKERILFTPKRTTWGDFTSIDGMQDIIIDLYLGGLNKILIGTLLSSFSEMQWWFGGCTAEYKQIKLHNN